jgi:hypothetical protein
MSDADWEMFVLPMVVKTENCWYWSGYTNQHGHGFINLPDSPTRYVHRLSLERKLGREISPGLYALHNCLQTPNCVNPDHLREGTAKQNQIDSIRDGTSSAKLTEEQVIAIRSDTRSHKEIAKEYAICRQQVSSIKCRKVWKHIS